MRTRGYPSFGEKNSFSVSLVNTHASLGMGRRISTQTSASLTASAGLARERRASIFERWLFDMPARDASSAFSPRFHMIFSPCVRHQPWYSGDETITAPDQRQEMFATRGMVKYKRGFHLIGRIQVAPSLAEMFSAAVKQLMKAAVGRSGWRNASASPRRTSTTCCLEERGGPTTLWAYARRFVLRKSQPRENFAFRSKKLEKLA